MPADLREPVRRDLSGQGSLLQFQSPVHQIMNSFRSGSRSAHFYAPSPCIWEPFCAKCLLIERSGEKGSEEAKWPSISALLKMKIFQIKVCSMQLANFHPYLLRGSAV